jgi:phosphate-selective porin OprO and OprP
MRRVRPIFEGTVYNKYDLRVMLDFGSGTTSSTGNNGFLQDAYVNARFLPEFQLQLGKFKEPVGLERLRSGSNLMFVERGYPTQLVPNRDVGIQVHGDLFDKTLRYEAGVFNGVADGGSADIETTDDEKDVALRLFAHPFQKAERRFLNGFGFGIAGTYGEKTGPVRGFLTPGQQRFFSYRSGVGTAASPNVIADGEHWRLTPQFYYYWGPLGIFGEYAISDQEFLVQSGGSQREKARHTAWQVAASYFVTGEENSWKAVAPRRNLSPANSGWGALEVIARVGQFTLDDSIFPVLANPEASAHEATSWGVGLNWHLNKHVKLSLNYEQTDFDGGSTDFLQNGEKVFLGRVQAAF